MNRKTVSLTASENLRVRITRGNAALVQLTGTGWSGTVNFKSSPDGVTWTNHPYELVHQASATATVAEITSVSAATTYFIKPTIIQFRIDVTVSGGTLDVVYREMKVEN